MNTTDEISKPWHSTSVFVFIGNDRASTIDIVLPELQAHYIVNEVINCVALAHNGWYQTLKMHRKMVESLLP